MSKSRPKSAHATPIRRNITKNPKPSRGFEATPVDVEPEMRELIFEDVTLAGAKSKSGFAAKVSNLKDKHRVYNADLLAEKLKDNKSSFSPVDAGMVTILGFEATSVIKEGHPPRRNSASSLKSRRNSREATSPSHPVELGEITNADANRIDAFKRLMSRKTAVFEDPSLQKDMQSKRNYKDNKIVASLQGLHAGFVKNNREDRLESMDGNATRAYLGRQEIDFAPVHRPAFMNFSEHEKHSSKINMIPRYLGPMMTILLVCDLRFLLSLMDPFL